MDIFLKIKQAYSLLNERNRRIADVFLRDPSAVNYSINEIGKLSETSAATVTRFVRKFDFESYEQFRIALARGGNQKNKIDLIVNRDDDIEGIKQKVQNLLETTARDTTAVLGNKEATQVVKALQEAGRIYLIGAGASSEAAYDFAHKMNRAGYQMVHNWDIHITIEMLHYISDKDVLLAYSYSGNTKEVRLACKLAMRKGAKVFLVTSSKDDELKTITTAILQQPTTEHLFRIGSISSAASAKQISTILFLGVLTGEPQEKIISDMKQTADYIKELES
jgi:DNA-binding MurR/RpiR family transcriptional regulator